MLQNRSERHLPQSNRIIALCDKIMKRVRLVSKIIIHIFHLLFFLLVADVFYLNEFERLTYMPICYMIIILPVLCMYIKKQIDIALYVPIQIH